MKNRDGGSVNQQIKKALWSLTSVAVLGQIRQDPGRGQNRSRGSCSLLQMNSEWKATTTNRMHSNDVEACGKKCCYIWFNFFLDAFICNV